MRKSMSRPNAAGTSRVMFTILKREDMDAGKTFKKIAHIAEIVH
jgi:hypothetical protein